MAQGTIKKLINAKGFGFIGPEGGSGDVFFHTSALEHANFDELTDGPSDTYTRGNIMSADLVPAVLQIEKIDTSVPAAAQTHVDNSFGNSFTFTENNVLGTHVLLESAKSCGISRFIHVSTDEVLAD